MSIANQHSGNTTSNMPTINKCDIVPNSNPKRKKSQCALQIFLMGAKATIHQGSTRFLHSSGKKCVANTVIAIVYALILSNNGSQNT